MMLLLSRLETMPPDLHVLETLDLPWFLKSTKIFMLYAEIRCLFFIDRYFHKLSHAMLNYGDAHTYVDNRQQSYSTNIVTCQVTLSKY